MKNTNADDLWSQCPSKCSEAAEFPHGMGKHESTKELTVKSAQCRSQLFTVNANHHSIKYQMGQDTDKELQESEIVPPFVQ
jgi:hypothetical protein